VYLKEYEDASDAVDNLRRFFLFYNQERPHQSLSYQTPAGVYFGQQKPACGSKKSAMHGSIGTAAKPAPFTADGKRQSR
jgi:hypothetical protein